MPEDLGGISASAELDLSPAQKSVQGYSQLLQQVNRNMDLTEKGFIAVEASGKSTANSINALTARAKDLQAQLNQLDPTTKRFSDTAKNLNATLADLAAVNKKAADAAGSWATAADKGTTSSKAFTVALGILGATSIEMVVQKMVDFVRQSVQVAITLEALETRARAIYGTAFPQVEAAVARMSDQLKRSRIDLLDYMTGFGTVLDSVGLSTTKVTELSQQLTELTVNLGKAFPNKSDAEIYQILEYGIEGSVRGLRQLGIVMDETALKYFAISQGIKTKVSDMTDEQKTMLRTEYLLDETNKLQQAGIENANKGIDAGKQFAATWKDFSAVIGGIAMPVFNEFLSEMTGGIKATIVLAQSLGNALLDAVSFGQYSDVMQQKAALAQGTALSNQNTALQAANAVRKRAGGSYKDTSDAHFWDDHNPGKGGGQKEENAALTEAKKLMEDIKKAETDILDTEKSLAEANKKRLDTVHEELEERKKMGVLTDQERRQLDQINNRAEYLKDKIRDATDEWNTQQQAVKKLQEEVVKYEDEIAKVPVDLQAALDKIDEETARQKATKIADLLKEQADLNDRLTSGQGLSEKDQKRLQQISDELNKAKAGVTSQDQYAQLGSERARIIANSGGTDQSLTAAARARIAQIDQQMKALQTPGDPYAAGTALFQADDLGKIDLEAQQKKAQAKKDSDTKLADDKAKLAQAQSDLKAAQAAELAAQKAVMTAYQQVLSTQTASYAAAEANTKQHVAAEVSEIEKLNAALDALSRRYANVRGYIADPSGASNVTASGTIVKRAGGGMVYGPGGPTSDSILAALSNGEGVIRAAAVAHYGGPSFVDAVNSLRLNLPRFAAGGVVNTRNDNSRTANITQHFHGQSAGVYAHPSALKWHARFALR